MILRCLVEGNIIHSTVRITGVSKTTITKLLIDGGRACYHFQNRIFRNLPCKRIEVDEIWSFVYAKEKNAGNTKANSEWAGDAWMWTAICPDTKLVPTWVVGDRSSCFAKLFINDLKQRLKNRIQLTSDGLTTYPKAIKDAFKKEVDYAQLVKSFGEELNIEKEVVEGNPKKDLISTSYVEQCNLTMRMGMRRVRASLVGALQAARRGRPLPPSPAASTSPTGPISPWGPRNGGLLADFSTFGFQPLPHPLRLQPPTGSDPRRTRIQRPALRLRAPPRRTTSRAPFLIYSRETSILMSSRT